uniref:Transmembrane protein n=1 Tax=Gongylonema pulchrum TaxID=637853 RepID=A0A183EBF1_9BILA
LILTSGSMLSTNEDAEILSRLGIIASNLKSPQTGTNFATGFSSTEQQSLKTDGYLTLTEEEDNGSNLPCVKGISTSVQSITLPNIAVNIHATNFSFLITVLSLAAIGFLIGSLSVYVLFTRINATLLLALSVSGNIVVTFLFGCSKTVLAACLYSLILGCLHGTIFRGGLIVIHGSNASETRSLFAVHASFAIGAVLLSLLSAPLLSGSTTLPDSRPDRLLDNRSLLLHLLTKRYTDFLSNDTYYEKTNSHIPVNETTLKPLKPDHVVGVESLTEPKTEENVQKRKEVELRLKQQDSGQNILPNNASIFPRMIKDETNDNRSKLLVLRRDRSPLPFSTTAALPQSDGGTGLVQSTSASIVPSKRSITELIAASQMAKLEAVPEVSGDGEGNASRWRAYSCIFLLLTSGTELIIGEGLTLYALFTPELFLSQRNGVLLTATFWLGICVVRLSSVLM